MDGPFTVVKQFVASFSCENFQRTYHVALYKKMTYYRRTFWNCTEFQVNAGGSQYKHVVRFSENLKLKDSHREEYIHSRCSDNYFK